MDDLNKGMETEMSQYPPPPTYNSAMNYGQTAPGYRQLEETDGAADVPPPQPAQPQANYGNTYGVQGAPETGYAYGQPDNDPFKNRTTEEPMFEDSSFSNRVIRRGFIRKVYIILFTQLAVTFGFTMLFSLNEPIQKFVQSYPGGMAFYYTSYGVFLVTYIALVCCPSVRRKHPGNLICLAVFTLAFTYMVATISSYYTTQSVMVAAGITTAVCLSISLFAIQTKIDFTMCSGLLFALVMVLIFFGFSCIIVYMTIGYSYFLVYDTQMIVGGRKHELSPEEYVYGALQLYIDVVYLFLIILSFFGGKSN